MLSFEDFTATMRWTHQKVVYHLLINARIFHRPLLLACRGPQVLHEILLTLDYNPGCRRSNQQVFWASEVYLLVLFKANDDLGARRFGCLT